MLKIVVIGRIEKDPVMEVLSAKSRFRIEFARLVNVKFSSQMVDADRSSYWDDAKIRARRAYWVEVIEPVWDNLSSSWDSCGPLPKADWESVVLDSLQPCKTPSQWRTERWRADADRKAKAIVKGRETARAKVEDKTGKKFKEAEVNTKAFWQGQSFGAASPVTKIDPSTYKLKD
jgi:hypothetical protein